jgi:hypothetical protein
MVNSSLQGLVEDVRPDMSMLRQLPGIIVELEMEAIDTNDYNVTLTTSSQNVKSFDKASQ